MVIPYHFGSGYGFRATWSIYVYFIYGEILSFHFILFVALDPYTIVKYELFLYKNYNFLFKLSHNVGGGGAEADFIKSFFLSIIFY